MTFDEVEECWQNLLDTYASGGDEAGLFALPKDMVEVTLEAFKDRKMYITDCENLRGALECKPTPHDYVATMTNFLDGSGAERAEATFNVDDYRVTIIAERKEEL